MQTNLQHHVLRAAGIVLVVAAGFYGWLLAHDAIAKPSRELTMAMQARTPAGAKSQRAAPTQVVARSEVVRNMARVAAITLGSNDTPVAVGQSSTSRGAVNLNTATPEELQRLPGIGPSKAAAIIAWRQRRGGFRRAVDLRRVKGIGYKTFKKLEPYLAVSGETTLRGR